ncbi:MAG: M48 family metallopeptidase [Candidatus Methylomirabilales bacterium]
MRQLWRRRVLGIVLLPLLMVMGCATAPYTKRSQLILISPREENQLGEAAFREVLSKEKISRDPTLQALVERIGWRIATVAGRPDYRWEFVVIDDPETANAFALPGGKVGVYTGIFPVAKTEGGLAAVMSHEVAHVLTHHGAERLSQGLVAQMGAAALQAGMAGSNPGVVEGVMSAYGLGANVGVLLPYSRLQETEADRVGLLLMAQASYDPREAVRLWVRMSREDGRRPPEFLSTHPSAGRRIQDLNRWLPNALSQYRPSPAQVKESGRLLPGIEGRQVR